MDKKFVLAALGVCAVCAVQAVELSFVRDGVAVRCEKPKMAFTVAWPKMTGGGERAAKVTRLEDREADLEYASGTKWTVRLDTKGAVTMVPVGARGAADKGISHTFAFSTDLADGKNGWSLNGGEPKPLPPAKLADPFLFKSDFKSLAITDEAGNGVRFRLPWGWAQFQDNRHWNNYRYFSFKSFADLPKDGNYTFWIEDAKGGAVSLAKAPLLHDWDYVRYPEAKEELWPGKGPIRTFGWQEGIRKRFVARREQDANAVFFIGDSLTEGWRTMEKDLAPVKVANRGVGGDTSRGCLFRFKSEVLAHQPAAVVIMCGGNDLTAHGAPEDAVSNIREMVRQARAYSRKMPIFVANHPPCSNPQAPLKPGAMDRFNALVAELAKSENLILVDRHSIMLDAKGMQDLSLYGPDRLHWNAKGYAKLAAVMKGLLTDKALAAALNDKNYAERPKVNLSGYKIVWRDEFDGDKIDETKWGMPTQQRQGASRWNPRNVSVKDGAAVLKIRKTGDPTWRYDSACLRTVKGYKPEDWLYSFTYGYVEARCKLPKWARSDYWFAVWMMVGNVFSNTDTRKGCEVDIMETFHINELGRLPHTIHWGGYGKTHNAQGRTTSPNLLLLNDDWHTFGCLWTKDTMSFTIDGCVTWTTDLKGLGGEGNGKVKSQGVPQVPGYIKLSVEAAPWAGPNGGGWERDMPAEDEVLIDWVRVWQK